ncbi:uncharacterized protein [Linepithema humile]|uniref:uncharacterized protein n=1 Tax=Linepithema humile TaxID=83485 RepID=UPI00351F1E47
MMITIQQAFRPLFILCFIVGLRIYPIKQSKPKNQWIGYLYVLYFLTVWFAYSYLFYNVLIDNLETAPGFTGGIFITFTSAIFSLYHQKRFEILIKRLAKVDDTLEELGTPKMYRKMYMQSKRVIICWIIYILTVFICEIILQWYMNDMMFPWDIITFNITYYYHHINAFIDLLFILFLRYIGSRFDKVSEHMQSLLEKMDHELRCTWKKSVIVHKYSLHINNYKRTIWTSMHLHLELCHISRNLNMIFGMQLTSEVIFYITYLPIMCFFLCVMIIIKYREFFSIQFRVLCWTFIFLVRFCSVNYICETVTFKANNIDKIIHQLVDILRYNDVSKEIHQFTLQTMRYSLKFNRIGLLYFGNEFLRKFTMTILTSIIILAQFCAKLIMEVMSIEDSDL